MRPSVTMQTDQKPNDDFMLRSWRKQVNLLSVILFVIFASGCDKFEGDQTVPAYINVVSVGFQTDYLVQGTNNQQLIDSWVYVDDQLIGGFEMPFTVPVLSEGPHTLEIRPGIKLNGISDTRAPYPMVKPIVINDFVFTIDSISKAGNLNTTYMSNVEFVWMEDFEDASLSIKKGSGSDTSMMRTQPADNPDAFLDEHSRYSGIAYLDSQRSSLILQSDDGTGSGFVFDRGDFIFLELNYKTQVPVVVGMYINTYGQVVDRPFIIINSKEDWNKIYINFTPIVNETTDGLDYKIYFKAEYSGPEDQQVVMFDNIKLITRPNL